MYVELPLIETSTPVERVAALRTAQELLDGQSEVTTGGIFGQTTTRPRNAVDPMELIRLAEYITTGHDYRDTHPEGKRRPVIKKITNVHVHPALLDGDGEVPDAIKDMVDHLIHHLEEDLNQDPRPEADPDRDSDTPPPAFKL